MLKATLDGNPEKKGSSIEDLVLLIEEAFKLNRIEGLASKIDKEIKDTAEKPNVAQEKSEAMSYTVTRFTNDYIIDTTAKSPYVPNATYSYSTEAESNVFVPRLQTYYVQEKTKDGESMTKTNFQIVTYNDVREIQRAAKMNNNSKNNYVDPRMELEYKYWSLFSFNFIISGMIYNHIGS